MSNIITFFAGEGEICLTVSNVDDAVLNKVLHHFAGFDVVSITSLTDDNLTKKIVFEMVGTDYSESTSAIRALIKEYI